MQYKTKVKTNLKKIKDTYMFGMHKPRHFVIKCKPNCYTMSIWVSIHIYFFFRIFVYLFSCLPNKLYIIIIIYSGVK